MRLSAREFLLDTQCSVVDAGEQLPLPKTSTQTVRPAKYHKGCFSYQVCQVNHSGRLLQTSFGVAINAMKWTRIYEQVIIVTDQLKDFFPTKPFVKAKDQYHTYRCFNYHALPSKFQLIPLYSMLGAHDPWHQWRETCGPINLPCAYVLKWTSQL